MPFRTFVGKMTGFAALEARHFVQALEHLGLSVRHVVVVVHPVLVLRVRQEVFAVLPVVLLSLVRR